MEEHRGNAEELYAVGSTLGWSLLGSRVRVRDASENLGESTIAITFLSASRQDLLNS